jgi:pre-mRNA-processing factor 6
LLWTLSVWSEPRPARKTRSADALRKTKDNPLVICTVARIFWSERKIEKAREWFGRALAQDSDLGDIWAWWLKFEKQHGTEETCQEVIHRCVAAEPHHSPVWQSVAKDDKNVGRGTKEILEIVAIIIQ